MLLEMRTVLLVALDENARAFITSATAFGQHAAEQDGPT